MHDHLLAAMDVTYQGQKKKLTAIDLLNRQQLLEFQDRLGKLKTCFALSQHDLDTDPKCPHCGFWPSMEGITVSAEATIDALKSDLGKLQKSWTQSLLDNLGDLWRMGEIGDTRW